MNAALDALYIACDELESACRPYERLGLVLTPAAGGRRTLHVGLGVNTFRAHFVADTSYLPGPRPQPGAFAIGLRVPDLAAAVAGLEAQHITGPFGEPLAWLGLSGRAGVDLIVREEGPEIAGAPDHAFPLERLDHLATVAHDLDATGAFWRDALGVPAAGEVRTDALVIRQLRLGGAVLELLAAASASSPIRQRPAGLVSMASWQVPDVAAAVAQARAAGFTAPDPIAGPLPGTRISTIAGTELAGVNMQLLQYV